MSVYTSKNQICGLSLGHLGNNGSVGDIDTPVTDVDIAFSLNYDIGRQTTLRRLIPNFAKRRRKVARDTTATIVFGYAYAYEYPSDCLKVLGIGEISERENDYVIEADDNDGGTLKIYTDQLYEDGLPIRMIYDETNVGRFTADFTMAFSYELAALVAKNLTQNGDATAMAAKMRKEGGMISSALDSQESRPVRKSESRFAQARYANITSYPTKK